MNALDRAVLQLVECFVGRQRLARDLLHDRRPDFLSDAPDRKVPTKARIRAVARGAWGPDGEWTYRIHGHGCTMRHATTGEPIRWVALDLTRFDPYWLAEWIAWLLERRAGDAPAAVVRHRRDAEAGGLEPLVFGALDRLVHAGRLRHHPGTTNMYELPPTGGPG